MQGGASRLVNTLQHLQRIGGQGCRKASLRALTAETAGATSNFSIVGNLHIVLKNELKSSQS